MCVCVNLCFKIHFDICWLTGLKNTSRQAAIPTPSGWQMVELMIQVTREAFTHAFVWMFFMLFFVSEQLSVYRHLFILDLSASVTKCVSSWLGLIDLTELFFQSDYLTNRAALSRCHNVKPQRPLVGFFWKRTLLKLVLIEVRQFDIHFPNHYPLLPSLSCPCLTPPIHSFLLACGRTPECPAVGPFTQHKQEVPTNSCWQAWGRNEPSHGWWQQALQGGV